MGANAIIKRDSSKMGWGLNHVRVDLTPVYVKVKFHHIQLYPESPVVDLWGCLWYPKMRR